MDEPGTPFTLIKIGKILPENGFTEYTQVTLKEKVFFKPVDSIQCFRKSYIWGCMIGFRSFLDGGFGSFSKTFAWYLSGELKTRKSSSCAEGSSRSVSEIEPDARTEEADISKKDVCSRAEIVAKTIFSRSALGNEVDQGSRREKTAKKHYSIWTRGSELRLVEAVYITSRKKGATWKDVAELLDMRTTGKQCRERYMHHADPAIIHRRFEDAEKRKIVELRRKLGNHWALIAKELSKLFCPEGRRFPENAVKNAFYSSLFKMQEDPNAPLPPSTKRRKKT